MYVCMYGRMYVCTILSGYPPTPYVCMCVCMYVITYVRMYVYMYHSHARCSLARGCGQGFAKFSETCGRHVTSHSCCALCVCMHYCVYVIVCMYVRVYVRIYVCMYVCTILMFVVAWLAAAGWASRSSPRIAAAKWAWRYILIDPASRVAPNWPLGFVRAWIAAAAWAFKLIEIY